MLWNFYRNDVVLAMLDSLCDGEITNNPYNITATAEYDEENCFGLI